MKKVWELYPAAPSEFIDGTGLPPVIAQVLYNRGITSPEEISSFLNGDSAQFHDPRLLPDMDHAVSRLVETIDSGETVGVFGDFDVDGVTATAILTRGLERLGAKVAPYIPHRVDEGHGLNLEVVQALKQSGVSVLVTVDCGVTSHSEVSLAADLEMDVIITDHHTPTSTLPPALAIVDPKVPSSTYPFDELTGAGLAFKLVQGLYQRIEQPWPRELLALAAMGTVADLAPLQGENRSIVREGIKELQRSRSPGLLALYRHAGLRPDTINSEAISFTIAPRLNAPGRLQHAISSYRLLTTSSDSDAESLAAKIEGFNLERRQNTEDGYETALPKVKADEPIILIADEAFSPGISGLVASRLVEKHYKPTVVMALDGNLVRASARSIPSFNIIAALEHCRDLFQRHGGHPMAAGFVMERKNLHLLEERLTDIAREFVGDTQVKPPLRIDAVAYPADLMGKTFKQLTTLEPFGYGNPNPVFLARGMKVVHGWTVGNAGQHLRLKLRHNKSTWSAIAFRQGNGTVPLGEELDVVFTLSTGSWRGQKVLNLKVLDFRPAE